MKNYFNPNRLTVLVNHLMSEEMEGLSLQMQAKPIYVVYEDGSFDYMEPTYQ
jgi:hypothetical protein